MSSRGPVSPAVLAGCGEPPVLARPVPVPAAPAGRPGHAPRRELAGPERAGPERAGPRPVPVPGRPGLPPGWLGRPAEPPVRRSQRAPGGAAGWVPPGRLPGAFRGLLSRSASLPGPRPAPGRLPVPGTVRCGLAAVVPGLPGRALRPAPRPAAAPAPAAATRPASLAVPVPVLPPASRADPRAAPRPPPRAAPPPRPVVPPLALLRSLPRPALPRPVVPRPVVPRPVAPSLVPARPVPPRPVPSRPAAPWLPVARGRPAPVVPRLDPAAARRPVPPGGRAPVRDGVPRRVVLPALGRRPWPPLSRGCSPATLSSDTLATSRSQHTLHPAGTPDPGLSPAQPRVPRAKAWPRRTHHDLRPVQHS